MADVTDAGWLSEQLLLPVASVAAEDMSGAGGWSGAMRRLHVVFAGPVPPHTPTRYVVKTTQTGTEERSRTTGSPREALFYSELEQSMAAAVPSLPHIVYAHGDMATGLKTIVMADLSEAVQAGYFFGPGSPHKCTALRGEGLCSRTD